MRRMEYMRFAGRTFACNQKASIRCGRFWDEIIVVMDTQTKSYWAVGHVLPCNDETWLSKLKNGLPHPSK